MDANEREFGQTLMNVQQWSSLASRLLEWTLEPRRSRRGQDANEREVGRVRMSRAHRSSLVPRLRLLLSVAASLLAIASVARAAELAFANPLIEQRADPHLMRDADGYYYFMGT